MDVSLFHALNGLAGHGLWPDRLIEWAASYLPVVIGAAVALAWFWPGAPEERGERERLAVYAVAAALIALGIAQLIGHVWFRDRPYVHHAARLLLPPSADPSFPSDHATGAFGLAAPFVLARHRLGPWMLGLAVLIAVSRVAAGTHYPTDVVAGALLGGGAGWLAWSRRRWVEPLMAPSLRLARRMRLA